MCPLLSSRSLTKQGFRARCARPAGHFEAKASTRLRRAGRSPFGRHTLARHSREGGNPVPLLGLQRGELPLACGERVVPPSAVTPWLVIPAKAGIQCLCFGCKGESFHSPAAGGTPFFACTKKRKPKKCTPGIARFGLSARNTRRRGL